MSTYADRENGLAPNGTVGLREFDEGVVTTLGAIPVPGDPNQRGFYLKDLEGIEIPEGRPGIPVTFSFPEDMFVNFKNNSIMVRRESHDPAQNRWSEQYLQYRAPAVGALPIKNSRGQTGWSAYESRKQAWPYDISYSINIYARDRRQANAMVLYVMRMYPPYCFVRLLDSIQDERVYQAIADSPSPIDDGSEAGDRMIGFTMPLRVIGELDLDDVVAKPAATEVNRKVVPKQ